MFGQFKDSQPNKPDATRRKIYPQPLGEFPPGRSPSPERLREDLFCSANRYTSLRPRAGFHDACKSSDAQRFFSSLTELATQDLAARATPKGCEDLGYSLILSIRNVAVFAADIIGSHLADHDWPFASLMYLSAGRTAIVLILLPLLPAAVDTTVPNGRSTKKA